jgi:two-component system, NtrC family, sensor kinase
MTASTERDRRVLIVDDNLAIHADFKKILETRSDDGELEALEAQLFGDAAAGPARPTVGFDLGFASQGAEALAKVEAAIAEGRPYAMAFVDMRMPPGWDGLETIERVWAVDPAIQVVICSAFSDYSWEDVRRRLGERDGLLIIKKPFDPIEVIQCAHALTAKWQLDRSVRAHVQDLEARIQARMRELAQMETELRLAQKLESVGRLAAGIAHEINTPIQFASDMATFLRDAFPSLIGVTHGHAAVSRMVLAGDGDAVAAARAAVAAEQDADLAYIVEHIPEASGQVIDGLERVATIVRAMKAFAHPGQDGMATTDLNRAVESTLTIARNEYRYVADLRTDLGELPLVQCRIGEINQAILNLVVNAAHAIRETLTGDGDGGGGGEGKGTIVVTTRADGDWIRVTVADNGAGIPEAIRDKIFDPFFTTKPVGQGTGQGLALTRSVIAAHGGTLSFESVVGRGTTFEIRIPVAGTDVEAPGRAA